MLNEIRRIYGCSSLSTDVIAPIINGCKSEILADVIVDKLIGQIPVLGIGANIMCAKAMTWRLGLLFAMLSARGEDISTANVVDCTRLIRKMFPQTNMFKFKTPSISVVEKLLDSAEDADPFEFDAKAGAQRVRLNASAFPIFDRKTIHHFSDKKTRKNMVVCLKEGKDHVYCERFRLHGFLYPERAD